MSDKRYGSQPANYTDDVLQRAEARVSGDQMDRWSDPISDFFNPAQKEERQLGQQIALMKAEPTIQMRSMMAAGINPYTAAGGVSKAGSTASPQPAQSSNPVSDVAGAVGNVAAGFNSVAGGVSTLSKLGDEIENLRGDTKAKFAAAGLDDATTEGVLTDNSYKDEDWKTRLNVQRQQFENMKQEFTNLQASHDEIMKHIDEMQSQIELNGSQEDYLKQMRLRIEEETRWMKVQNEWRESHKLYITDSGIDGYIFSMVQSGASMSDFDNFIEIYSHYRNSVSNATARGQYSAEAEFANQISHARKNGENASDVLYGRIGSPADLAGRIASLGTNLWNGAFNGAVSSIKDLFKIGDAKKLRSELTSVLNNAYEQLDKFPDDSKRLHGIINDLQMALQLSNKELLEWSSKNWN